MPERSTHLYIRRWVDWKAQRRRNWRNGRDSAHDPGSLAVVAVPVALAGTVDTAETELTTLPLPHPPTTVLAKKKKKKESSNINASDFNSLSQLQRCYTAREPSSRKKLKWCRILPPPGNSSTSSRREMGSSSCGACNRGSPYPASPALSPTTPKLPKTAPDTALAHSIPVTLAVMTLGLWQTPQTWWHW